MNARLALSLGLASCAVVAAAQTRVQGQAVATRTQPAKISSAKIQRAVIPAAEVARLGADQARSKNGYGPGLGVRLSDVVRVEQLERFGLEMGDLARLSLEVYADANPDSGIYYYRPSRYALRFEPEEGYYLSVDYKAGAEAGKNVLIQARLTPGAGQVEHEILRALLRAHTQGRGPEPTLMRLPASYEARFDLSAFGVETVTVSGIDTDTGEVVISFATSVATKELLTSALGNVNGLVGTITLSAETVSDRQTFTGGIDVPAYIRMADIGSGPRLLWRQRGGAGGQLVNPFPFPLQLRHLCYLVREPAGGALRLRGWSLGETRLAPGDTARLDLAALNAEVDSAAVVAAFYDAALVRDDDAVRRAVEELTGGVGALPVHELWVEAVKPAELFQQYGIYRIAVEVRSLHFDPEGRSPVSHSYELDEETPKVQCDPLYRREGLGPGAYEYKVGIVTVDGTVHADSTWRPASATLANRVFVGATLIEEVLGR